jgi:KaiC/GvpD/RAD55 family RecA-like ATPase
MASLKEQVSNNIAQINEVVEMFYQQKTQEAYVQLDKVLGDFSIVVDSLYAYQQENSEAGVDVTVLLDALKEALSAVQEKDAILVADVLKYELIEKLEEMESLL